MKKIITMILLFILVSTNSYSSEDLFRMDKNIGDSFNVNEFIKENTDVYDDYVFSWTASNYDVIKLKPNGEVFCEKNGKSQLVGFDDLKDKTVYVNVIVKNQVEGITLGVDNIELPLYYKMNMESILYHDLREKLYSDKIEWTSSNENVATIDQNGRIETFSEGETHIIASSNDGSKTDSIKIKVTGSKLDIDVDYNNNMKLGESQKIDTILNEEYNSIFNYDLLSLNPEVAEIDSSGVITTKSMGVTYISISYSDKVYKVIPLRVNPVVKSIVLSDEEINITDLENIQTLDYRVAYVSYKKDEEKYKNIKVSSSSPNVAYVNKDGKIIARSTGTTNIVVSTNNGYTYDKLKVTVELEKTDSLVHSFKFKNIPGKMYVGEIIKLDYDVNYSKSIPEFKLLVSEGSNRQIYDEFGTYYFKPETSGLITITVKGPNGFSDKQPIFVGSKLSKIDMNSGNYIKDTGGYRIYIGQSLVIEPNFVPNGYFLSKEILNKEIDIEYDDDYMYSIGDDIIKAIKSGESKLSIETIDSDKMFTTKMYAKSAIKTAKFIDNQSVSIGEIYKPKLDYTYEHGLTHAYDNNVEIEVLSQLILVSSIKEKIGKIDLALREIKDSDENKVLISRLLSSKATLSSMLKNSRGEYATISGKLYDSNGRLLSVANVYDDYMVGNMKGALKIKVKVLDNNQTVFGQIEFK